MLIKNFFKKMSSSAQKCIADNSISKIKLENSPT